MNSIWIQFLKDRRVLISCYMLSLVCIVIFFRLSKQTDIEYVYPLILGIFFLCIYLVIDGFKYYRVNSVLKRMLDDEFVEFTPYTEEQKLMKQVLHKIQREHTKKMNDMNAENQERIYFLSHWMHYLKTPVSVIDLIIQKEKLTEAYKQILQENKRLHTSIEQGLTMLRMEEFGNDLEIKAVDLLETLRKIINKRKREFIYQSIFPTIETDEAAAYIATDSKWNEFLLEQVISNAIKYSSLKTGNKTLVFHITQDKNQITLAIKDEGIGIPAYDLERIFQPFFTGENGRKFDHSTGIGLYLSKRIADTLGHKISITSKESAGTTVSIQWTTSSTF